MHFCFFSIFPSQISCWTSGAGCCDKQDAFLPSFHPFTIFPQIFSIAKLTLCNFELSLHHGVSSLVGSCNSVMYWHILFLRCFKGWEIAAWIPLGCKRIAESDSREGRGQTFPPRRLVFKIEWTLTPPLDYIVTQLREDRQTPRHSDSQTLRHPDARHRNSRIGLTQLLDNVISALFPRIMKVQIGTSCFCSHGLSSDGTKDKGPKPRRWPGRAPKLNYYQTQTFHWI